MTTETDQRSHSLEELKARSREAGLRLTRPRLAVLAAIHSARRPLSQRDVAERIEPLEVDRTTLFRNLKALVRASIIRRVDGGDRVWRFELTTRRAAVARFTCIDCGAESTLANTRVVVTPAVGIPRSVLQSRAEVRLLGSCDSCASGK